MSSRDKTTKSDKAKPSSGTASGVSNKRGVEFDISEEDLDKASGSSGMTADTTVAVCVNSLNIRPGRG
jgi:hypothetical protein